MSRICISWSKQPAMRTRNCARRVACQTAFIHSEAPCRSAILLCSSRRRALHIQAVPAALSKGQDHTQPPETSELAPKNVPGECCVQTVLPPIYHDADSSWLRRAVRRPRSVQLPSLRLAVCVTKSLYQARHLGGRERQNRECVFFLSNGSILEMLIDLQQALSTLSILSPFRRALLGIPFLYQRVRL